tara:strand:+ start:11439 stop:11633 length:195 start_codon:yes stop_codon:yes gene_type:complete
MYVISLGCRITFCYVHFCQEANFNFMIVLVISSGVIELFKKLRPLNFCLQWIHYVTFEDREVII